MPYLSRRNVITIPLIVVLVIASAGRCGWAQDETKESQAEAPPKHAVLQHVQGGAFYV